MKISYFFPFTKQHTENEKITHNRKKFEAQMSSCGSLRKYMEELFLREEKIKTNSFLMDKRLEHVLHRKGKSHGQGTQAKTQTSLAPKEMQIAITRFSKMRGSVRASGCQGRGDGPSSPSGAACNSEDQRHGRCAQHGHSPFPAG